MIGFCLTHRYGAVIGWKQETTCKRPFGDIDVEVGKYRVSQRFSILKNAALFMRNETWLSLLHIANIPALVFYNIWPSLS